MIVMMRCFFFLRTFFRRRSVGDDRCTGQPLSNANFFCGLFDAECLVARTVVLVSLQALCRQLPDVHRRAKSKPVSLGGGWELAVVLKAGDSSAIPAAPDVHGGLRNQARIRYGSAWLQFLIHTFYSPEMYDF